MVLNRWEQLFLECMTKTKAYRKWVTYAAYRMATWGVDLTDDESKRCAKEMVDEVMQLTRDDVQKNFEKSDTYKKQQARRLLKKGDSTVKEASGTIDIPVSISPLDGAK